MNNIHFQSSAVSPGDCISDAWALVSRQFGLYLGMGLLTMVLISCVPFVNFFLMGPILGGFYYVVLRDQRDEPVDFGMLFKGFEKFLPLMLVGLIQGAPSIVLTIVQYTVDIARLVGVASSNRDISFYQSGSDALGAGLSSILIISFIILFFFSIAWHLAFEFAMPLVIEHDLSVTDALVTSARAAFSNSGSLIVLMIFQGFVMLLGVIALCLGIFVAFPVVYAAVAIAYRQVFPYLGPKENINVAPPPPDFYGGTFGRGQ